MAKGRNPFVLFKRKSLDGSDHRFEPKHFRAWLEQLPVGDSTHAAKALYEQLRVMNGVDLPVADRLHNLESCMPHLVGVLDMLARKVSNQAYPLSQQVQKTIRVIMAIHSLTAKAYKIVLDQYSGDSIAGFLLHKQNRALALNRILYMLGRVQLSAYQYYLPLPEYLWREMHAIYRYGKEKQLVGIKLAGVGMQESVSSTAADIYKQALLLSLAGPYRLLQGEAGLVYRALIHKSEGCHLLELDAEANEGTPFIIDFAADHGPQYRNTDHDTHVTKGCLLDTRELAVTLASELDRQQIEMGAVRPHGTTDVLPPELLAKMMLAWGIGLKRVSNRTDRLGKMVLVDGLENLYEAMGGSPVPANREWCVEEVQPPLEMGGSLGGHLAVDDHWLDGGPDLSRLKRWDTEEDPSGKMVIDEEVKEDVAQNESVAQVDPVSTPKPTLNINPEAIFIVLDESESGYHLSTAGSHVGMIKVGELVGLSDADKNRDGNLKIGIIRWLKMQKPNLLDFGVELLSGNWTPVAFRQHRRRGVREYYRALQLEQPGGEGVLITEPFYSEGVQKGFVLTENSEKSIHFSRVLEATASFLQFQFSITGEMGDDESEEDDIDVAFRGL